MIKRTAICLLTAACFTSITLAGAESGKDIIEASGVKGGIVLHLGCGDGSLTSELRVSDSFIVQGLDADESDVKKARKRFLDAGLSGVVSASHFDGENLPFIDNLVNVIVITGSRQQVAGEEIERVLAPGGAVLCPKGHKLQVSDFKFHPSGEWMKATKPVPPEIDEWTHYLRDPDNNAVSRDQKIHSPKYLQWVGSPRYSRHHDHMSAMSACVTSGGRLYHLMDDTTRLSIYLKPKWKLVARDAFNGMILWKRDMNEWYNHLHRLKSGPAYLPRKLVSDGDLLFASLGIHEPLSVIDGATGKTLKTLVPDMECDEILHDDGVLYLVGSAKEGAADTVDERAIKGNEIRRVVAVEVDSEKILWETETRVLPVTLTLSDDNVYYHDGTSIVAHDRKSGKKLWVSEPREYWKNMHSLFAPTLVAYKDLLFFAGGEGFVMHRSSRDTMYALSANDGRVLWSAEHPPSGYQSAEDILVVDGLVWVTETTSGGQSGELIGRDPWTGEEKKRFPPTVETYWFHHRCYRAKATDNYFLLSRTGIEFVDHKKEEWEINHWVRGACLYGVMPANGFTYAPQHPCACYPEVKLNGFNALSSNRDLPDNLPADRLVKGPAFAKASAGRPSASDWPTFRADSARSGSVKTEISNELEKVWKIEVGESDAPPAAGYGMKKRISQPVIADGRIFVAEVDAHTVHAYSAKDGEKLWSFITGARVDSAPTIYKGMALFGSNDGWVYCLRAEDGELAWKYQAAPRDARHMVFEQLESVWPVPGNIMIQDDTAYFACGRNIFLDGGIELFRMNPLTGEVLSQTAMTDKDPDGRPIQDYIQILNMPPGQPDILSSDGERVYMRSQPFDMEGKRLRIDRVDISDQRGEESHLFCPSGFLDDSWWHRTYQVYGRSFAGGHSGYHAAGRNAPSGKIMTFDDKNVYAFARHPEYYKWTTVIEHQLYSVDKRWTKDVMFGKPDEEARRSPAPPKEYQSLDSMILTANSASLDPAGKRLCIEAWIKAEAPNGVVIARGGPANGYALVLNKGKPEFIVRTDGEAFSAAADVKVLKRWTHLAGLLTSDNKLQIYVNGFLEEESGIRGPISALPIQPTEIGADDQSPVGSYKSPSLFSGLIDEVRVFHGSVTKDEIKKHARDAADVSAANAELVLRYTFDNGKAQDSSGNGNNGKLQAVVSAEGKAGKAMKFKGGPAKGGKKKKGGPKGKNPPFDFVWNKDVPLFARAMVKVSDKLIVAGPRDIIDETKVKQLFESPEMQIQMERQSSMIEGKVGGVLWVVSDKDGSRLGELSLDTPPVFDGMAAANGRLYLTGMDGSVTCLKAK